MYSFFCNKQTHTQNHAGFSLIEVMVAMSIFVTVVSMSVGTLFVLLDANGKAQNMEQAMTNVSFALDSMSREIRTGTFYYGRSGGNSTPAGNLESYCPSCDQIFFNEGGESLTGGCSGNDRRIGYRFNSSEESIERKICTSGSWERITSTDVVIDEFRVTVRRTSVNNDWSPLVTLYVEAHSGEMDATESAFTLQSSVTQQAIDI